MIIFGDAVLIGFKCGIVSAFVLQAVGGIQENLVARVAPRHNTEDTRSVVILGEDFIHRLVYQVCHKFQSEFLRLTFFTLEALRAVMLCHAYTFQALGETENVFALREAGACNK